MVPCKELHTKSPCSISSFLNHSTMLYLLSILLFVFVYSTENTSNFSCSTSDFLLLLVFLQTVPELEASHIENYLLGTNGEGGIFSLLRLNYSLHSSSQGQWDCLTKGLPRGGETLYNTIKSCTSRDL
ncbi:hypothetical protein AMECASPLE_031646 [Ameca splendens]|uniref:Uncharacterized protein n=1 Tax=Ameca splendens TaxID=208324 RepID=A0ABV0XJH3_9TELE